MAKHIDFIDAGTSETGKTRLWHVVPKGGGSISTIHHTHGAPIGVIHWYGPWRKYCFSPHVSTIYEMHCLRDIADFCEQQTIAHRSKGKFPMSVG